jgi:hypothetical protein
VRRELLAASAETWSEDDYEEEPSRRRLVADIEAGRITPFAAGVFAVTLWGYDGDYGLEFSRGSLAEAIELAERYLRDVPGPDDIGCAACVQQTREWLRVHDPANDALAAMEEKITLIV